MADKIRSGLKTHLFHNGYIVVREEVSCEEKFSVQFEMEVKTSCWHNGSMGIERGPLVFALDMNENWNVYKEIGGMKDYEIRSDSSWNYALIKNTGFEVEEKEEGDIPFRKNHPPVVIKAKARKIFSWEEKNGSADDVPISPVETSEKEEMIRLIPFGCTKLRIAQFPYCEK